MRAVYYDQQGAARDVLRIGEVETPQPAPGEVLVRVHASACNPSDTKLRAGSRPMGVDRIIPHSDGAGVITAIGDGVAPARIGERVWLWNGQWQRAFGTCAEYICLPEEQAVILPEGVGYEAGACFGIPAMTAYHCVFGDGPVDGQVVLVTGGAGTVARYAIQMAKLGGATVITTVSSQAKADYARQAGADHILNYKTDDVADAIDQLTTGVDRIIELEFGGNLAVSTAAIRPSGVIAAYGSAGDMEPKLPFYPLMFKNVTLRMVLVYLLSKADREATIAGLTKMLETNVLTHSIAARFSMNDVINAHELVETADKTGSVVLQFD